MVEAYGGEEVLEKVVRDHGILYTVHDYGDLGIIRRWWICEDVIPYYRLFPIHSPYWIGSAVYKGVSQDVNISMRAALGIFVWAHATFNIVEDVVEWMEMPK